MKQFIIFEAITGELIAIRPESILSIDENKGNKPKIVVKTEHTDWNISSGVHSVRSIVKEIEEMENSNNN